MRAGIITITISAMALSACTGDNPDNVPLYGQWDMETKLGSLSIDGVLVPPETVPGELKAMAGTDSICGEPMFINREWQKDDINRKVRGDCTMEEYDVTPTRVTGSGVCTGVAPEAEFNPRFTFEISQSAERYRMKLEMTGDAKIPGDSRQRVIRVSAIQEGIRSGEC